MKTQLQELIEKQAFGVCEWLGQKWGIQSSRIRLYFIYVSFLTFGSPLIIYFILLFWIEQIDFLRSKRPTIWDY
ncbi:MAG: PspC family transcriptional regulator [Salibacteraceae bacterium]|jgi:phage shock protein C|nr:PspC family transcriptional regulator [Salibacteraceae bacterium]